MSKESIQFREATEGEVRLFAELAARSHEVRLPSDWLRRLRVRTLNDGKMGSFRLSLGAKRVQTFGRVASSLQFTDTDGVIVLASLYLDDIGEPFEVDVWKTDFTPVKELPSDLRQCISGEL